MISMKNTWTNAQVRCAPECQHKVRFDTLVVKDGVLRFDPSGDTED